MGKHINGALESAKFDSRRKDFYKYREFINKQNIPTTDLLEHFTAYVGHMSLNRMLTLYELYKKVQDVAGHIAEVGVYKGAGTLFFAKLLQIFESESLTQVHGFNWFEGAGDIGVNDSGLIETGSYSSDKDLLLELIKKQKLDHIVRINDFDITKELNGFFNTYKHLQFKLVFLDAGIYDVMQKAIPLFWERLTPGGIMILDQYNHELAPGESLSIRELLPNAKVKTIANSWMPNAYIIKD